MNRLREALPRIASFILIGIAIQLISNVLGSNYVATFMENDLLSVLLALLAINITTISVIMSKLREMAGQGRLDYSTVVQEMRYSVTEQIVLMVIAATLLILNGSEAVINTSSLAQPIIVVGLISVLVYAIRILYDTGGAIFKIATIENERMLRRYDLQLRREPEQEEQEEVQVE